MVIFHQHFEIDIQQTFAQSIYYECALFISWSIACTLFNTITHSKDEPIRMTNRRLLCKQQGTEKNTADPTTHGSCRMLLAAATTHKPC